ncbi:MAG: TolC family protein, partial [Bacteroidaceae bacterium]|nr:TolC family protein [Bacteroidaceae bacterium]
ISSTILNGFIIPVMFLKAFSPSAPNGDGTANAPHQCRTTRSRGGLSLLFIFLFVPIFPASAQSFNDIVALVLQNNSSLKAAKSEAAAAKEQRQVGLTLPNPQVEAGYLFGSPRSDVNDRIDLSVKQEFDFATLSGNKRRVADAEALLLDRNLDEAARQLKQETVLLLTDITYYNKLLAELQRRKALDDSLLTVYKKRLDKGDVTILDYNKAKLSATQIAGQISKTQAERDAKLVQLQGLAHVKTIVFNDTAYTVAAVLLPETFEEWATNRLQNAPSLRIEDQRIAISKAQTQLAKSETLPSFSIGYTSELVKGSNYRGVAVGVQVPLWANRNKLKAAQRAQQAAIDRKADTEQQLQNQYRQLFFQAKTQQRLAAEFKAALQATDNRAILTKALNGGQMTLTEYLLEQKYYYDNYDQWLSAEREAMLAVAELISASNTSYGD